MLEVGKYWLPVALSVGAIGCFGIGGMEAMRFCRARSLEEQLTAEQVPTQIDLLTKSGKDPSKDPQHLHLRTQIGDTFLQTCRKLSQTLLEKLASAFRPQCNTQPACRPRPIPQARAHHGGTAELLRYGASFGTTKTTERRAQRMDLRRAR